MKETEQPKMKQRLRACLTDAARSSWHMVSLVKDQVEGNPVRRGGFRWKDKEFGLGHIELQAAT